MLARVSVCLRLFKIESKPTGSFVCLSGWLGWLVLVCILLDCLSAWLFACVCVFCLFAARLPACLFVMLFVCLSVCLSVVVCLFVVFVMCFVCAQQQSFC